jgi:hypothetical protein
MFRNKSELRTGLVRASREWSNMTTEEREAYLCAVNGIVGSQIAYMVSVGVPEAEISKIVTKALADSLHVVAMMLRVG